MQEEEYVPPEKKAKRDGNIGWDIMFKQMKYKGSGLGTKEHGYIEPVKATNHSGRMGLGLADTLTTVMPDTVWSEGMDDARVDGDIVSVLGGSRLDLDKTDLDSGKVVGERKLVIDGETNFCDEKLLMEMLKCKSVLDKHSNIADGRSRSNPYEKIGKGIYLNRAAMKMLNMDFLLDGLFTKSDGTLFFADVCAGPGGFTEYVLWRRPLQSCGFGFTLRGSNDFKMRDIICGPSQCFHPFYGRSEDGDVTSRDNLERFRQEVLESTAGLGVHSVMADGGFSVEGQESIQEIISKQIYLCQFLCAINILRTGGNFVCKLFDTFTDFSVGLIHLVSTLFSEIIIIKPITSRPANSERYIVFKNFTQQIDHVEEVKKYLFAVNDDLNEFKGTEKDVVKVIPHNIIKRDHQFYQFIKDINNKILRQQIVALAKLLACIEDLNIVDDRQMDLKNETLKRWGISELRRENFYADTPNEQMKKLIHFNFKDRMEALEPTGRKNINQLSEADFMKDKFVIRNFCAGFISGSGGASSSEYSGGRGNNGSPESSIQVLAKDRRFLSLYETMTTQRPHKLSEAQKGWFHDLPNYTVLLVNFGIEFGGCKGNMRHHSLVVVDAAMIYGEDISMLSYEDRMKKVTNLCNLLDPKNKGRIRPLDYFPLFDLQNYLNNHLESKKPKNMEEQQVIRHNSTEHFFPLGQLLIINLIKEPWMKAVSRRKGYSYYFNVQSKQSVVEKPDDLYASYSESRIYEVECKKKSNKFSCPQMLECWHRKTL